MGRTTVKLVWIMGSGDDADASISSFANNGWQNKDFT